MQKVFKRILGVIVIGLFIFISSCQVEESISQSKNGKYKMQQKRYEDLLSDKRIAPIMKNASTENNLNRAQRTIHSESNGFYIDTDKSNYIEDTESPYTSYTFNVIRPESESSDYLENLVLSFPEEGLCQITLIKYELTPEEQKNLEKGTYVDFNGKIISKTSLNDSDFAAQLSERLIFVDNGSCFSLVQTSCSYGNHPDGYLNGKSCPGFHEEIVWTFCNDSGGGSSADNGGSSNDNGSNTSGTVSVGSHTSGGSTNTGSNPPNVTAPIAPQLWQQVVNCLGQLSESGTSNGYNASIATWLQTKPRSIVNPINSYLQENACDLEAQILVCEVISAISEEDEAIVEDFINDIFSDKVIDITNIEVTPPDCESFNFTSTGVNWQMAAVSNIHFQVTVLTPQGAYVSHVIDFPQPMLFEAPKNLLVGNTTVTPGMAASASAMALKVSMQETVKMYGNKPVTELIVRLYFEKRLQKNFPLFMPGGRIRIHPTTIPVTPTQYQTNAFGIGDCN